MDKLLFNKTLARAVIFDMDGVIFDSERACIDCWITVAEKYDIPGIEASCIDCIGITSEATTQKMLAKYGADFPLEKYRREADALFEERYGGNKLPVKPGAAHLLQHLQNDGIPVALASSTGSKKVKQELLDAGLLAYFDVIVGGEMAARSKPAPDIFLEAARRLLLKSGRILPAQSAYISGCYVIEDSFNGIRAASAAGMHPIMVPDILQPDEEIRALTEAVLPSLTAVEDYLL